jgi:hypothetical protein
LVARLAQRQTDREKETDVCYPNHPKFPGDIYNAMLAKQSEIVKYWLKKDQTKVRVAKHRLKKRTAKRATVRV